MSGPVLSPLPPVILVHGFASSYEHNWVRTGWADTLGSHGHQVIGIDLPGHGGNDGAGGAVTAAGQLIELARSHAAVDLVGFSAGARICAIAAASGQVPVRRLVLAGLGDSLLHGDRLLQGDGPADGHGDRDDPADRHGDGDDPADRAPMSLTGPLDPGDVRSSLFRRMAASAGNDPGRLEGYLAAPAGKLTPGVLARISCPALVIIGERDHLGPAAQVMASLPAGTLLTLPRTDHFGTASHVEAILAAAKFLAA
jgi:pimeloyl-ACP methyl ester carboxylesterase